MKFLWIVSLMLIVLSAWSIANAADRLALTLPAAIDLALQNSPEIIGAKAEYGAASGERRQAATLPNPTLGFEAENIAGSGPYNGTNNAEMTIGLNQTIPIAGKRSARIAAADYGLNMAEVTQTATGAKLIRDVTIAFNSAVASQERARILQTQAKLAKDMYMAVNKRVTAAAAPLVQRNKAKIALANAELLAQQAQREQNSARLMLQTLWNNVASPSSLDATAFYAIHKPAMEIDQSKLQQSPRYQWQQAAIKQAQANLDLERANAIPDPTFSIGVRELKTTDDQALVAGVSIPLPVFNLNSGNIEKARHQVVRAEAARMQGLLGGQAQLIEHQQALQNAWAIATRIKTDILPQARQAYTQAKRGYQLGKFAYLDVLDAQRTLSDTRIAYIEALRNYHIAQAEIDQLIAPALTASEEIK